MFRLFGHHTERQCLIRLHGYYREVTADVLAPDRSTVKSLGNGQ